MSSLQGFALGEGRWQQKGGVEAAGRGVEIKRGWVGVRADIIPGLAQGTGTSDSRRKQWPSA